VENGTFQRFRLSTHAIHRKTSDKKNILLAHLKIAVLETDLFETKDISVIKKIL